MSSVWVLIILTQAYYIYYLTYPWRVLELFCCEAGEEGRSAGEGERRAEGGRDMLRLPSDPG